jgi:hypothetical protein
MFTMAIAIGVGSEFRVSGQEVIDACEKGKIDGHKLLKLWSVKYSNPPQNLPKEHGDAQ